MSSIACRTLFALALSSGACKGGSELDPSTTLDQLTGAEIVQFCNDQDSLLLEVKLTEFFCYAEGVLESLQEGGECTDIYDACIASRPAPRCLLLDSRLMGCAEATLGEVDACIVAIAERYDGTGVSCESDPLEIEEILERDGDDEPPECDLLGRHCDNDSRASALGH